MSGRRISVKQKLSRSPTHLCLQFVRRKIATLFAGFTLFIWIEKAVQRFFLRHRLVLLFSLDFFFFFSAPLGRLTPNEALPQTPTGLCPKNPQWVSPLDPDQGRAPGPFARFARWVFYFVWVICSVWRCHSSLLTPHL